MFNDAIASRAVGQFPLSIATSLAIESACGIHPEIKVSQAPILAYQELWVNLRTLFRNFLESLDKTSVRGVQPEDIAHALITEMEQIESIIGEYSNHRTKVVYYVSNYKNIESRYRLGVIRRDNTDRQKEYSFIQNKSVQLVLQLTAHGALKVLGFDLKLKAPQRTKALILTHYAYDLLSYPEFSSLTLIESHTGAIKERAQWYTKYHNGKELSMIPFREDFIQIFGDSQTFRPADLRLREALIEVATKNKWSAVTTRDKIIYGINQLQNPYHREILKDLLV